MADSTWWSVQESPTIVYPSSAIHHPPSIIPSSAIHHPSSAIRQCGTLTVAVAVPRLPAASRQEIVNV